MNEQEGLFFTCLILIVGVFLLFGCSRTYQPPPHYVGYSLEQR